MAALKKQNKKSIIDKAAEFIVDKRKAFYLIYAILLIFSVFSLGWVKVNNSLTDYLSKETQTRQGLDIMNREFMTYATASVMVDNLSYMQAEEIAKAIEKLDGVKEVEFDETDKHFSGVSALFSVTFDGDDNDEISSEALERIRTELSDYDTYISAQLGNTKAETIASEVKVVMVITAIILLIVLFITSKTYMEILVLILTFCTAALLNKGTNFLLGTISFVSDSVAIVLQLALAIDYAIILCHRYTEEREGLEKREAVVTALKKAIPEISGSCLTTLSGLGAMCFMNFKIGLDLGVVLIKAIIISIICVFTLMPGLLMSFGGLIDKTHHKSFIPSVKTWGDFVVKSRYVTVPVFAAIFVCAIFLANRCPFAYSVAELSTFKKNDSQIASQMINQTFRRTNNVAVLVPSGDYDSEKKLCDELGKESGINSIRGLASIDAIDGYTLADKLSAREFCELCDIDINAARLLYSAYAAKCGDLGKIVGGTDNFCVPLIEMFGFVYDSVNSGYVKLDSETNDKINDINDKLNEAKEQLKSEKYTRIVLDIDYPEESPETFDFLEKIKGICEKYYDDGVYLVGNSTNDRDISDTFGRDNIIISILSVVFVLLILLFTFRSAGLPIVLILVIQGSIWINFSYPAIKNTPIFFLSYLVVSSMQMGANIDYAIVITNRFNEYKKLYDVKTAATYATDKAFPTVFTSGTILACAGFATGLMSSDASISSLGICLGRGTLISIVLVMLILPQLLIISNSLIEKTSFEINLPSSSFGDKGGEDKEVNTEVRGKGMSL